MLDWTATWQDLDPPPWLALLPLGSIEQHGPWLPIGTDWYQAGWVGEQIAKELDAWLLPAQPYSCAQEHQDFPGTITLRPATLAALLTDIAASVARAKVKRLIILNYHGGNWALKSIVRDLNRQQRDIIVFTLNPYEYGTELSLKEELHSGEFETGQMLYLRPDLVREGRVDCVPDISPALLDQVGVRAVSPQGQWGRASRANAADGERNLKSSVQATAQYIREMIERIDALRAQEE